MIKKGFIATCEWCGEQQLFTITKTKKDVEHTLKQWGWTKFEKRDFCCQECKKEYLKEEESC